MSIINGAEAILDGFGKSPPSQELAQERADSCLKGAPPDQNTGSKKCPYNHLGGFSITAKASELIHAQREKKLALKLRVEDEEGLGVCKVCKCFLPLKVFYDIETIYGHTEDSVLASFPDWCWIKRECQKLQNKPQ